MKLYQIYYSNTMYSVVVSAETIEEAVSKFRALNEYTNLVINAVIEIGISKSKDMYVLNLKKVNNLHNGNDT